MCVSLTFISLYSDGFGSRWIRGTWAVQKSQILTSHNFFFILRKMIKLVSIDSYRYTLSHTRAIFFNLNFMYVLEGKMLHVFAIFWHLQLNIDSQVFNSPFLLIFLLRIKVQRCIILIIYFMKFVHNLYTDVHRFKSTFFRMIMYRLPVYKSRAGSENCWAGVNDVIS